MKLNLIVNKVMIEKQRAIEILDVIAKGYAILTFFFFILPLIYHYTHDQQVNFAAVVIILTNLCQGIVGIVVLIISFTLLERNPKTKLA